MVFDLLTPQDIFDFSKEFPDAYHYVLAKALVNERKYVLREQEQLKGYTGSHYYIVERRKWIKKRLEELDLAQNKIDEYKPDTSSMP